MGGTAIVTGGAGFIGSHLVDSLLGDGFRVVVVDDLSSGRAANLAPEAELVEADVRDLAALERVFASARPRGVFHLAAQSLVPVSLAEPERDLAVNALGTLQALRAAASVGAPLVLASSGAVYGEAALLPTPESAPAAPRSPYGASKLAAEAYLSVWARSSGLPHAACRLGNVYGPRQPPRAVVPTYSLALFEGRAPTLLGHGEKSRDFVHVSDVVAALRAALGRPGVYNVATGVETRTRAVFELLRAAAQLDVEPELVPLPEGEIERSCLSPELAARALGFRARIPLAEGVPAAYRALAREFASAGARQPA